MEHVLELSPDTMVIGYIDNATPPALEVESGDTVVFEIAGSGGDAVSENTTLDELVELLQSRAPHAGMHSLTGPIAVRGAKPGQALKVDILDIVPREYGFNFQLPADMQKGLLPDDFPNGRITHYRNNLEDMTIELYPGVVAPLAPFMGILATAPAEPGKHHSVPPWNFGGNIDLAAAVVGTSVYLPVQIDGANFFAGDAHSVQGHGEVCTSAIETAFSRVEVRLEVVDMGPLARPRVETDSSWITLGIDEDLLVASQQAIRDMIELIGAMYSIPREDAYTICSATVDLSISQIVNGVRGVHASLPKSIFVTA